MHVEDIVKSLQKLPPKTNLEGILIEDNGTLAVVALEKQANVIAKCVKQVAQMMPKEST